MKQLFTLAILICLTSSVRAQQAHSLGLIVKYPNGYEPKHTQILGLKSSKTLSRSQQIELLSFFDEEELLRARTQLEAIGATVQSNVRVDFRLEPNDEFYPQQNNFDRIGFPELWEEFRGGQTDAGKDIVIAILDSGFDFRHEDIEDNLWQNQAEIPNDGIDNDQNGYIDDIFGWNFVGDRPNPSSDTHGSSVTGILGARGDNEIGVSGTNWNSQLMLFQIEMVADIIEAYDYIIEQRRLYNETNGAQGAFVVATNASFGLEGQACASFPMWAEQYDRLGEVGILTAASTANREWDVDDFGDMPTTCTTDFLITVANSDSTGSLFRSSAWGLESIDLAAPGQGSFTTLPNDRYGGFGSTSAAAPYVTGTIALLYGHPCERFQQLVREDPKAAALLVREAIVGSVRLVPQLASLVATGGELSPWEAWQRMDLICETRDEDNIVIFDLGPNPVFDRASVSFDTPGSGPYFVRLYDAIGRQVYEERVTTRPPVKVDLLLGGLPVGVYRIGVFDGNRVGWASLLKM